MRGLLTILFYLVIIIGIGALAGWIFKNALVGFFTVGGIIVLWAIWGMIQGIIDSRKK
jgi:hypothetical protein